MGVLDSLVSHPDAMLRWGLLGECGDRAMYSADERLIFSASDLTGFLACRHLTQLDLLLARGEIEWPHRKDLLLDVISQLGDEHEANYLAGLKGQGLEVAEIADTDKGLDSLEQRAAGTLDAMKVGADVIFQGTFFDGTWRGHADFLLKVDRPSDLGDFSYEVSDTKLARKVKAAAVLQICEYSSHVARLQGLWPEYAHLVLGDRSTESFKLSDYTAYHRAVKREFSTTLDISPLPTYPDPVEHCKICRWAGPCNAQRRADRHLTFVAGISKGQIKKLQADAVPTIDALGASKSDRKVKGLTEEIFERLQDQAALQLDREKTGVPSYHLLPPSGPGLGLEALPEPTDGDLFFDIESDRYAIDQDEEGEFELDGLEYLFGWIDAADGCKFHDLWAHDAAGEKEMFETFVDLMIERLDSCPDMHVYHYGAYEPSALKRLMNRYGTREDEVDRLLRAQAFVDLYRVVRQSMRISEERYSIKNLEVFYDFERTDEITEAGSSMIEYERYRDTGDEKILEEIRIYNEADCRSTVAARDWLEGRRKELEKTAGPLSRPPILDGRPTEAAEEERNEIAELITGLTDGIPAEEAERDEYEQSRWLLAQMLEWHRREDKSDWWAYFERRKLSDERLLEDREAIAGLTFEKIDGEVKQSYLFRYSFPAQETKLDRGADVVDVRTGTAAGAIWHIDFGTNQIWLKRGKRWDGEHPDAVGPGTPPRTPGQRAALQRIARSVIQDGLDSASYRGALALLRRKSPSFSGGAATAPLVQADEAAVEAARRLVVELTDSYLPVQGPPGTGKTYTGARMILDLIRAEKRVGVTANSHKVISNLLQAVDEAAKEEGVTFKGAQKCEAEEHCSSALIEMVKDNSVFDDMASNPDIKLLAGTSWALTRPALEQAVDVLFIDEAGQFSLANSLAVATAARSLVLLGDPQQLNQPTKSIHPDGADASSLSHVLGDAETIASDRGLFLERTFRMHPALTAYVSDAFYDGRLESEEGRERQVVDGGMAAGIHLDAVTHEGNRIFSWEEADEIALIVEQLIGKTWTTPKGESRVIGPKDLIVVAPFNAQVARIRQRVPVGVPVGTVDKFQGQEGVVAIYSMTTSSPEDIPRNFEFLYSRNRLNVAVSRAKSAALVVCNPVMLLPMCKKPEHMRLANALCLLVEHAKEPSEALPSDGHE